MKRLLFVILLTIMGCCGVHVQAVGYEKIINPVLPGDRPDPTVIEINGEYWAAPIGIKVISSNISLFGAPSSGNTPHKPY